MVILAIAAETVEKSTQAPGTVSVTLDVAAAIGSIMASPYHWCPPGLSRKATRSSVISVRAGHKTRLRRGDA